MENSFEDHILYLNNTKNNLLDKFLMGKIIQNFKDCFLELFLKTLSFETK